MGGVHWNAGEVDDASLVWKVPAALYVSWHVRYSKMESSQASAIPPHCCPLLRGWSFGSCSVY